MKKSKSKSILFTLVFGVAFIAQTLTACAASPTLSQAEANSPTIDVPQEVQRISLEDSKAAFDSRTAVFLDVRSASSYATGHIPGALSIPLAELEPRIDELDPDQWTITYCT